MLQNHNNTLSNEEYFAHPALNASAIKMILENPYNYFNNIKKPQSKSMEFGEKVHKLVLESDLEYLRDKKTKVVIEPQFGPLTLKANKEAKSLFYDDNKDNYIVTQQEYDCAKSLLDSQFGYFFSKENKENGFVENVYFGKILGYDFKCKPDFFLPDLRICIDLKTTTDSHERSFLNSVLAFKYHIQAYIYSNILGIEPDSFIFIVVEKETPYYASSYLVSEFFELAEKEIKKAIDILEHKEIYNKNVRIHGIENNECIYIKNLSLPAYLMMHD